MKEKLPILVGMIQAALGEDANISIDLDSEGIHLAGREFTIYETEVARKRIGGEIKVPGYGLGRSVYRHGVNGEPDDGDFCELAEGQSFEQVATVAIIAIVEARCRAYCDMLDTEAQAKELF
jgi:hypothetical protein